MYNKSYQLQKLKNTENFDIVVIDGSATGLGITLDATTHGYKTLLVEAYDFA